MLNIRFNGNVCLCVRARAFVCLQDVTSVQLFPFSSLGPVSATLAGTVSSTSTVSLSLKVCILINPVLLKSIIVIMPFHDINSDTDIIHSPPQQLMFLLLFILHVCFIVTFDFLAIIERNQSVKCLSLSQCKTNAVIPIVYCTHIFLFLNGKLV